MSKYNCKLLSRISEINLIQIQQIFIFSIKCTANLIRQISSCLIQPDFFQRTFKMNQLLWIKLSARAPAHNIVPSQKWEQSQYVMYEITTSQTVYVKLLPCPSTGPKMFWVGPHFLCWSKKLFTYYASHKHFVPDKKMVCIQ